MIADKERSRRNFLTGWRAAIPNGLSPQSVLDTASPATTHISSAVVSVLPVHRDAVARRIAKMTGLEIHYRTDSKLVVVIEAADSGAIGGLLAEIAGFQGVLSANMVFEQAEPLETSDQ